MRRMHGESLGFLPRITWFKLLTSKTVVGHTFQVVWYTVSSNLDCQLAVSDDTLNPKPRTWLRVGGGGGASL